MTALLIVLAVLLLIALIPLGVSAAYENGRVTAFARVSAVKMQLYPGNKEKKPKKEKKQKPKKKRSLSLDFSVSEWIELAKLALHSLGKLKRAVTVDHFELRFISADEDPFDAVKRYNTVNAVLYTLLPYFESAFRVRRRSIVTDTDLQSDKSIVEGALALSLRVWQIVAIAVSTLSAFWKVYSKHRKERKQQNGKQQTQRNDAVDHGQYQKPC